VATYTLSRERCEGRARGLELFPSSASGWTAGPPAAVGGEQQMVVLAQALVSQPRYILIDELARPGPGDRQPPDPVIRPTSRVRASACC
jgi:branched-chain amino acid transport system ATP-binding protein